MGNYIFTPTVAPDVDRETNNKNFWYWGYIDDLITDKMLGNIKDDDLQANLLPQE